MSVIIRLQNLPLSANSIDIRNFFRGLNIPDGGVHIVGGEHGDSFIAFSTDEDARQAMNLSGSHLKDSPVKLLLSSRNEMYKVIEQARQQALGLIPGQSSSPNPLDPSSLSSSVTSSSSSSSTTNASSSTQIGGGGGTSTSLTTSLNNASLLLPNQQLPGLGLPFPVTTAVGGNSQLNPTGVPFPGLGMTNIPIIPTNFPTGILGSNQIPGFPLMSPQSGIFSNPPPTTTTSSSSNTVIPSSSITGNNPHSNQGGGRNMNPNMNMNMNMSMSMNSNNANNSNNPSANNQLPPQTPNPFALPPTGFPNTMNSLPNNASLIGFPNVLGQIPGQFGIGNITANRMPMGMNNNNNPHIPNNLPAFNIGQQPQSQTQQQQQQQRPDPFLSAMNPNFIGSSASITGIVSNIGTSQSMGINTPSSTGLNVIRPPFGQNQQPQQHQQQLQPLLQNNPNFPNMLNNQMISNNNNSHNNNNNGPFGGPRGRNINTSATPTMNSMNLTTSSNVNKPNPNAFGSHTRNDANNSSALVGTGRGADRDRPDRDINNRGREKDRNERGGGRGGGRSSSRSRERRERNRRRSRSRSRDRDRRRGRRSRSKSKSREKESRNKSRRGSSRERKEGRSGEERRRSDAGNSSITPEKDAQDKIGTGKRDGPLVITIADDTCPCIKLSGLSKDTSFREIREFVRVEIQGGGEGVVRNYEKGLAYLKLEDPADFPRVLKQSGQKLRGSTLKVDGISLETWDAEYKQSKREKEDERKRDREHRDRPEPRERQRTSRFNGAPSQSNCISIRGLPPTVTPKELSAKFFPRDLNIIDVAVANDNLNGRHTCTAYVHLDSFHTAQRCVDIIVKSPEGSNFVVEFCELEDLHRAKRNSNNNSFGGGGVPGNRFGTNNGNMKSIGEAKSLFDLDIGLDMESNIIAISGVSSNVTERAVVDFFSDIGIIPMNVQIMFDPRGVSTGQVLCEFQDSNKARRATTKDGMVFGRSPVQVSLLPSTRNNTNNQNNSSVSSSSSNNNNNNAPQMVHPNFNPRGIRPALLGPRPSVNSNPNNNNNNTRFPTPVNNNVINSNLLANNNQSQNPFTQALQQSSMTNANNTMMNPMVNARIVQVGLPVERSSSRFNTVDDRLKQQTGTGRQEELDAFSNPGCVIALQNIPFKASMDDVLSFLKEVLGVQISRDRIIRRFDEQQKPTGDVRIALATTFEAQLAAKRLQGQTMWKRALSVSVLQNSNFF